MLTWAIKFCVGSFASGPRISLAPLPLTHVSHIKSMLFSHRAGRVPSLFTDLDFCPVMLGLPRDLTNEALKKLLQKMDMKTFHSLHFLQFGVQSQHKFHFQDQQVCSCSLTVPLQRTDPDCLHSPELWKNLRCLLWSTFRAPAHLNQCDVLEGMFACDGAPKVHACLGHSVVFVCFCCWGRAETRPDPLWRPVCSFLHQTAASDRDVTYRVNPFTPTVSRCRLKEDIGILLKE